MSWVLYVNSKQEVTWEGDLLLKDRPQVANRYGVLDTDYEKVRQNNGELSWYCAGNIVLKET